MLRRLAVAALACLAVGLAIAAQWGGDGQGTAEQVERERAARPPEPPFSRVEGVVSTSQAGLFDETGLEGWRAAVPAVEEVRIASTRDRTLQPALWLAPAGGGPRPLLVVLHSWSTGYRNIAGSPYARWAQSRGWAMVQPDFRGPFDRPQATGSDLSVQDVMDAVDFASRHPGVDPERVFAIGFSGGGMMSLLLAGRHPDRFRGVATWVPIHDLADWHRHAVTAMPDRHYAGEIEASCGGDPTVSVNAAAECQRRSPRAHLDDARAAGIPVYIGHGLSDDVVPPDHALRAFNRLVAPPRRVPADVVAAAAANSLPPRARGSVRATTFFGDLDPEVVFARQAGPVRVVLFDGEHDMVYHPALEWMVGLARRG